MISIKTGCWFAPVPDGHLKVGISRAVPRAMPRGFRMLRDLMPGSWFNRIPDPVRWAERYQEEILGPLDPDAIAARLVTMAEGRTVVLCCFEQPPPDEHWCHRALVSAWLYDSLGLEVPELGHEALGFGWRHPKLSPLLRRARNTPIGGSS